MTTGPQAMFVVEYPCDRFCRIELDVSGERGQVTVQRLRDDADTQHRQAHEPEAAAAPAEPQHAGRPAATVFLAAPGQGTGRRR